MSGAGLVVLAGAVGGGAISGSAAVTAVVRPAAASADGAGHVTLYAGIASPDSITAGPDKALWFTNLGNNSIGRITTAGSVSTYLSKGISRPVSIAAGPDGALWFTNQGNNSIGRITTGGTVTSFTDPS